MNHQPDRDLEELLTNTRYAPPKGFESNLQLKLDGLVNQHGDSVAARLSTYPSEADRRALVSKRRINVLAFAIVAAGIMIVGLILILPTLPVPQPAVQPHQAADATPSIEAPTSTTAIYISPVSSDVAMPDELTPGELVELFDITKITSISVNPEYPDIYNSSAFGEIAFSPDGNLIAVASKNKLVIWALNLGQYVDLLAVYPDLLPPPPYQLAFSPSGRLAVGGGSGTITIFDPRAPQSDPWFRTSTADAVYDLSFSGDGSVLVAAYKAGKVPTENEGIYRLGENLVVWDMVSADQSGEHTYTDPRYIRWIRDSYASEQSDFRTVAVNVDASQIFAGAVSFLYLFYADGAEAPGSPLWSENMHGVSILDLRIDNEATYLGAAGMGDVWEFKVGKDFSEMEINHLFKPDRQFQGCMSALNYSADGSSTALVKDCLTVQVITNTTNGILQEISLPSEHAFITDLAFSPDGNLIAISLWDGTLWLWRWR